MLKIDMTMSPKASVPNGNMEAYERTARTGLRCIENALASVNKAPEDCKRILDFGCGYGRVLRALRARFPEAEITACDLNQEAIMFCAETFDAIPIQGYTDPSKIVLPHKYDAIWVGSVFTHLPAEKWAPLIEFFQDNLADDGLLVFSIHGRAALWVFENHTLAQSQMSAADLTKVKKTYAECGYAYMNYTTGHVDALNEIGMAVDDYGLSFTRPDWVTSYLLQFGKMFMTSYNEGGWGRNHDVVTLWLSKTPRDVDYNSPVAEVEEELKGTGGKGKLFRSFFSRKK